MQFVDRTRFRLRALRQQPHRARIDEFERHPFAVARTASAAPSKSHPRWRLRATVGTPATRQAACRTRTPRGCAARSAVLRRSPPGTSSDNPVAFGAPASQPDHTSVKPSRSGKAVAEIRRRLRCVARHAGAHIGEQHDAAAIVHFVQDAAIAARRIGRAQDDEVAAVLAPGRAHCAAPCPAGRCRDCPDVTGPVRRTPCRSSACRRRRRRTPRRPQSFPGRGFQSPVIMVLPPDAASPQTVPATPRMSNPGSCRAPRSRAA